MIKIQTPKGTAGNLYLVRPDTTFGPMGTYKMDITLNAAEGGKLLKACKEEATRALGSKKAAKARLPGNENSDGTVTFRFRSRSKPNLYDSTAALLEPETVEALRIGDGSTIRVKGEAEAYKGFGGGVTLLLYEIQIIDLVESGGFEPDADGSFVMRE